MLEIKQEPSQISILTASIGASADNGILSLSKLAFLAWAACLFLPFCRFGCKQQDEIYTYPPDFMECKFLFAIYRYKNWNFGYGLSNK